MEIKASMFHQDWKDIPKGNNISKAVKTYKEAKSFYAAIDETIEDDTIVYEVYSCPRMEKAGSLGWGLTILHPLLVQGECNMTRGHFHAKIDREEYYWCMQGEGLLMLMDEAGTCWCEEVKEGSLHHIQGKIAHRLINTGNEDLMVTACWPGDSGHDYEAIETKPFYVRVFKEEDTIIIKERV